MGLARWLTGEGARSAMAETIADTRRLISKPQNLNDAYGPPSNFLEIDVGNPQTVGVGRGRFTTYEIRVKVRQRRPGPGAGLAVSVSRVAEAGRAGVTGSRRRVLQDPCHGYCGARRWGAMAEPQWALRLRPGVDSSVTGLW